MAEQNLIGSVKRARSWRYWVLLVSLAGLLFTGCQLEEPAATGGADLIPDEPSQLSLPTHSPQETSVPGLAASAGEKPAVTTEEPLPTPTPPSSPTPDPTRTLTGPEAFRNHIVQFGETLGIIAERYDTSIETLVEINKLASPDALQAGETVLLPAGDIPVGPAQKLIPDSELVYGPACSHFHVPTFVSQHGGYLATYRETIDDRELTGSDVVLTVAQQYSVNPRLLLALLEFRAGWVTQVSPRAETLDYPMGRAEAGWDGLYNQLSWTANQLNRGYYGWQAGWLRTVEFDGENLVELAPGINAGTAAVQSFLSLENSFQVWENQVGWDGGPISVYRAFFGNPFTYAIEPLIPADLTQPEMALPWAEGALWYFTGAPHGGWGTGSGWAALDFKPGDEQTGCYDTDAWVLAVAPGRVVRSDHGEVVVDMDDDGFEGTGWSILYMHIADNERVPVGTWLETGDQIGHPSCEGGYSNGTHLHIARRYNGRWIEADGPVPFVMSGWLPASFGSEYDGTLTKGDQVREAWGWGHELEFNGIVAGP
jgi:LasA protease